MTYPPAPGSPDPYGQQNPYGQQPDPYNPYGASPGSPAAPQYGQPPQSPYAQPYPPAAPATNTMAILSLVFAFVFSPLGIVFGHMAKKQIRERGEGGDGLATAGLVLGYIFTGLYAVICCIYGVVIIAAINSGSTTY
jgi:Domain of unknown function (DUF4190)